MVKCEICNKEFKNTNGLAKHITNKHKDITKEDYYKKYINQVSHICKCGNIKKFRNLGEGYRLYCSVQCRSNFIESAKYWKDKKQPAEMIEKRIKNTNQSKKQQTRENTLIERYDDSKYNNSTQIGISNTGKKLPQRTKEHSNKIIESKRKNGTLNHSDKTKETIKYKINELYQSCNPPVTISENSGGRSKHGYVGDLFYRSSYEKIFIEYCIKNNIEIQSAENKKFRVRYYVENKQHFYYPDFYLPKYDAIIEVKPKNMLKYNNNNFKINEAIKVYEKFFIITEDELIDLNSFFNIKLNLL